MRLYIPRLRFEISWRSNTQQIANTGGSRQRVMPRDKLCSKFVRFSLSVVWYMAHGYVNVRNVFETRQQAQVKQIKRSRRFLRDHLYSEDEHYNIQLELLSTKIVLCCLKNFLVKTRMLIKNIVSTYFESTILSGRRTNSFLSSIFRRTSGHDIAIDVDKCRRALPHLIQVVYKIYDN